MKLRIPILLFLISFFCFALVGCNIVKKKKGCDCPFESSLKKHNTTTTII